MLRSGLLLGPLVASVLLACLPSPAPAQLVDCDVFASYPNVKISSARNMSCERAAREMRRHRAPISARFRTPGGFRCARVSGGELGGQWRCTRGARAFRFDFGD